jgi:hypothetical protein
LRPNYAFKPIAEQALRSKQIIVPQRLNAALALLPSASRKRVTKKPRLEKFMAINAEDVYDRIMQMWLHMKQRNPEMSQDDLVTGVYFSVTNEAWPEDLPQGKTALDICEAVNHRLGLPKLTYEQMTSIAERIVPNRKEAVKFARMHRSHSIIKGLVAVATVTVIFIAGMNWVLFAFAASVFVTDGVTKAASAMHENDQVSSGAVGFLFICHVLATLGTFALSGWLLFSRFSE